MYSKASNKNVQLVLQHCYKTSRKAMLRVLLATYVQTRLVINHLVGCENLLQKVESSCTFFNKTCTCCAINRYNANTCK